MLCTWIWLPPRDVVPGTEIQCVVLSLLLPLGETDVQGASDVTTGRGSRLMLPSFSIVHDKSSSGLAQMVTTSSSILGFATFLLLTFASVSLWVLIWIMSGDDDDALSGKKPCEVLSRMVVALEELSDVEEDVPDEERP